MKSILLITDILCLIMSAFLTLVGTLSLYNSDYFLGMCVMILGILYSVLAYFIWEEFKMW